MSRRSAETEVEVEPYPKGPWNDIQGPFCYTGHEQKGGAGHRKPHWTAAAGRQS